MDAFSSFTLGTSLYLAAQSLPLLIYPSHFYVLLSTSSPTPNSNTDPTPLEQNTLRSFAAMILLLSISSLLFSGIIPGTKQFVTSEDPAGLGSSVQQKLPTKTAILLLTTFYHIGLFTYGYSQFSNGGGGGGLFSGVGWLGLALGSGAFSAWGGWCLLFGGSGGKERKSNFVFQTEEQRAKKREKREKKFEKIERIGKRD